MRDDLLSVIVRIHEGGNLAALDQALFSLSVSDLSGVGPSITRKSTAIQVILVYQCVETQRREMERVLTEAMLKQPFASPMPICISAFEQSINSYNHALVFLSNPEGQDMRSRALNVGLHSAQGRYLAFLDYDDVVYQRGYAMLISELQRSPWAGLAAGATVRATVDPAAGGVLAQYISRKTTWLHVGENQIDLLNANFLPLNSFVLDRTRIPIKLFFNESLTRLEDYDFLLRLGASVRFNFALLATPVCEYRLQVSGSDHTENVNPSANRSAANLAAWANAKQHIEALKREVAECYQRWPYAAAPALSWPLKQLSFGKLWSLIYMVKDQIGGWWPLLEYLIKLLKNEGLRGIFWRIKKLLVSS